MLSLLFIKIAGFTVLGLLSIAFVALQVACVIFFKDAWIKKDWSVVLLFSVVTVLSIALDFLIIGLILQKCGM